MIISRRAIAVTFGLWSLLASACSGGGPTSPSTPAPRTFHGSVTDPIGDARPTSPNSPDLTSATIDVANGSVTITVGYVPGSVSQADVYIVVIIDTDLNPATGYAGVTSGGTDARLIGGDYLVDIPVPQGASVATVSHATSTTAMSRVGTAGLTFSANQVEVSFPLALLGGSDGHCSFKVVSAQYLNGGATTTGVSDIMPDAGLAPGLVQ